MKDQKALLIRCMNNDIPAFVISGRDIFAPIMARFYLHLAKKYKCNPEFIEDFEMLVKHFEEWAAENPDVCHLPD